MGWGIFVFIRYLLLFKNFTDLQYIIYIKRTLPWEKNRNAKNFKIKFQQSGVGLKCSMDKKTVILQFFATFLKKIFFVGMYFLPICNNFWEHNCLNKSVFNNVSRLNHFSSMNSTVPTKPNTSLNDLFLVLK